MYPGLRIEEQLENAGEVVLEVVEFSGLKEPPPIKLPIRARTWSVDDARRHWQLPDHCEFLLVPQHYPSLKLPTSRGCQLWFQHYHNALPDHFYMKTVHRSMFNQVAKDNSHPPRVGSIIWCEDLIRLDYLDYPARHKFIRSVAKLFREQSCITMVSLEETHLERRELLLLLDALTHCTKTLRRLYLWNMVRPDQDPLTEDFTPYRYRGQWAFKMRLPSVQRYMNVLAKLDTLTVIAVRYKHLADEDNRVLLSIGSLRSGKLRELQLLCEETDLPDTERLIDSPGKGGYRISDSTWRRASELCPRMRLSLVICNVSRLECVLSFLSEWMNIKYLYYDTGIHFGYHEPRIFDHLIIYLTERYSKTIETLCLHLSVNREAYADHLMDVMREFPRLMRLEFSGKLHCSGKGMRKIMDSALLKPTLKSLSLTIQGSPSDYGRLDEDISKITTEYMDRCIERGLQLNICRSHK